jgi:hypothetical protein
MTGEPKHDRDSLLGYEMGSIESPPESSACGARGRADVEKHSIPQWWGKELAMMIVSLIAFIALVVILAVLDGKPVRHWDPLTLNSINLILTTVTGSALAAILGSALSQNLWNGFAQQRKSSGFTTRPAQDLQVYDGASRGPLGSLALLWKQGPL